MEAQQIINRLIDRVPALLTVEHAFTMKPVDDLSDDTPAAYVYLAGEDAGRSSITDNLVTQKLEKDFVVMTVARLEDMDGIRGQIRAALLGYNLDEDHEAMVFLTGTPQDIKGKYLWWSDTFTTSTHIRG